MSLPYELRLIIISYLPLKILQLFENYGYRFSDKLLIHLQHIKRQVTPNRLASLPNSTPFEYYTNIAMLNGQIGFNGQFYLLPYVCLLYAIRVNDLELINYYLLRYKVNDWYRTIKNLGWDLDNDDINYPSTFLALALSLSKNKQFLLNQFDQNKVKIYLDITNKTNPDRLQFLGLGSNVEANLIAFYTVEPSEVHLDNEYSFPFIDIRKMGQWINASIGCINKDLIGKARIMLKLIQDNFIQNENSIIYTDVLKVLLNQNDIIYSYKLRTLLNQNINNIDWYQTGLHSPVTELYNILIFAFSVGNSKIINMYPYVAEFGLSVVIDSRRFIVSEILYDLTHVFSVEEGHTAANRVSIYLNNLAYDLNDNSPIFNIYEYIEYGDSDDEDESGRQHGVATINDAETAYRLSTIIDINTQILAPATAFDKELMLKFGFKV